MNSQPHRKKAAKTTTKSENTPHIIPFKKALAPLPILIPAPAQMDEITTTKGRYSKAEGKNPVKIAAKNYRYKGKGKTKDKSRKKPHQKDGGRNTKKNLTNSCVGRENPVKEPYKKSHQKN